MRASTSSTSPASSPGSSTSTSTPGAPTGPARSRRSHAYRAWDALGGEAPHLAALRAMSIDLAMAAGAEGADVVHSHTWYANLGGHLAKLVHDIPHVVTVHSLEPLRPWKAEQLGGGYALSSWCERTALEAADAVVAVSEGMRARRPRVLPGARPRPRPGRSTTASTPRSTSPTATPTCSSATGSTRRVRRSCSSAGSPARRASRTSCAPRCGSTPRRSSSSPPARPTRPRSPPRSPSGWSRSARSAAT